MLAAQALLVYAPDEMVAVAAPRRAFELVLQELVWECACAQRRFLIGYLRDLDFARHKAQRLPVLEDARGELRLVHAGAHQGDHTLPHGIVARVRVLVHHDEVQVQVLQVGGLVDEGDEVGDVGVFPLGREGLGNGGQVGLPFNEVGVESDVRIREAVRVARLQPAANQVRQVNFIYVLVGRGRRGVQHEDIKDTVHRRVVACDNGFNRCVCALVADQVWVALPQHAVAPRGDAQFLIVVHAGEYVAQEAVSRGELEGTLVEPRKDVLCVPLYAELVVAVQLVPLLARDQLQHGVAVHVDAVVQVPRPEHVVKVVGGVEVGVAQLPLELLDYELEVSVAVADLFLVCSQMATNEAEGRLVELEGDAHAALVARHVANACGGTRLLHVGNFVQVLRARKHA
mmetsp:Transcript_34964/g.87994  ORF Transcript_34964/g.87994 Transcript_34964/m.87994 type:complete len:400 (+) Transcript_34964:206-1405(+)